MYYLAGGYASGTRIAEYDYSTQTTQLLSTAYGDYTYYSLQGAVNPLGASFALVAEAYNNGARNVNVYNKATYYTTPNLSTTYTNMTQPSVMVERSASIGSPTIGVVMKSTSSNVFYQSDGSTTLTSIGTGITSTFIRERKMPGNLELMLIKSALSPATIEKYTVTVGGGRELEKATGDGVQTNVQAEFIHNKAEKQQLAGVLNFSGSAVAFLDSLQTGNRVSVNVENVLGLSVHQTDSIKVPVGIDVLRNGSAIRSYSPSLWTTLTKQSIGGLQSGDVLRFVVGNTNADVAWYKKITLIENGLNKGGTLLGETLIPTEMNVGVYPNPFNPSTSFRISLPQAAYVRLEVFNMLGQKVATVVDGVVQAGYSEHRFEGGSLSSGIYLYRTEITQNGTKQLRSGKIMLVK